VKSNASIFCYKEKTQILKGREKSTLFSTVSSDPLHLKNPRRGNLYVFGSKLYWIKLSVFSFAVEISAKCSKDSKRGGGGGYSL